ncbi:MAG: DUF4384 domain-containing protein [Candidatus Melainabacteria bacterium]|nr:DUF4384 domain-containing protein [Candidatus Melainabacteria bacterium]
MISLKNKKVASLLVALAVAGFGATAVCAEDGAKGLFFEQLDSPFKSLNTGVQYYIELHRDGHQTKVTNKYGFKNGDKIKFHVKSNVDGYAYILLKSGSRGEQSVLFPDPGTGDDNKVKRGSDYVIPATGFLTFDDNPGTEKVSLVLSRTPIDAQAYLSTPVVAPTLIASALTGAKDLIPSRVLVHYSDANKNGGDAPVKIASNLPKAARFDPKTTVVEPIKMEHKASTPKAKKPSAKTDVIASASGSRKNSKGEPEGLVTVVSELPGNVLHVDVDLHHI